MINFMFLDFLNSDSHVLDLLNLVFSLVSYLVIIYAFLH